MMAANNCLLTNDTRSNGLETILTTQVKKSACFVVLRIFSGPRFGLPVPRLDAFYLMKVISHARLKAIQSIVQQRPILKTYLQAN